MLGKMEIERKFLLDKFPNLDPIEEAIVCQGYISTDLEVRIRSKETDESTDYIITVKGDGDLSRKESNVYISEYIFMELKEIISKPLIHKTYKGYKLYNGLLLECVLVDSGMESEFMYAEVEFDSEEEALKFIPPEFLGKEVTYDSAYKMKNYWLRTRC